MKKLLLIILLAGLSSLDAGSSQVTTESSATTVWICTGSSSECYHSRKNCKGLNSCRATIKEVTLEKAKQMKRRPCKMCYGR